MAHCQNLSPSQWENVLLRGISVDTVAEALKAGDYLPWVETLIDLTRDSRTTLDLGSGRGENSAALGLQGKETTLVDWSAGNLDFSRNLFGALNLRGRFCRADITRTLPFDNSSFDTVFSCGVLEYFSREVNQGIIREAFRIARRQVIMMVPNALSVGYRVGKWHMERTGGWIWGGEVPSRSLKREFKRAGSMRTIEFSVGAKHALAFLTMPGGEWIRRACIKLFKLTDRPNGALFRQGYLLITVGEKT